MIQGRAEASAVRAYLDMLSTGRPRGRQRTPESIDKRLDAIEEQLQGAGVLARLALVQERLDLTAERVALEVRDDAEALENGFVQVASKWAERKGISRKAWREIGVPAAVLRRAGL
jgi:hypothetical protein